nr:DUF1285 domain-containing protein [Methylocella silvestris]
MTEDIDIKQDGARAAGPAADGLAQRMAAALPPGGDVAISQKPLPPVESWNTPFCGDIDMRIARDGSWIYQGAPMTRPALVRLFSTILRKDRERFVLVTPAECVGITVEDAPFIAVEMTPVEENGARSLRFLTNVGDSVTADSSHPLRFERGVADGLKPYVFVRGGLWALVARTLVADLVALGETRDHAGRESFGVASGGAFFPIADASELAAIEAAV